MTDFSDFKADFFDVKGRPGTTGWTKARFSAWERLQPEIFEFDGEQPVHLDNPSARVTELLLYLGTMLQYHLCVPMQVRWPMGGVDCGSAIRRPHLFVIDGTRRSASSYPIPAVVFNFGQLGSSEIISRKYFAGEHSPKCVFLSEDSQACHVITRSSDTGSKLETVAGDDSLWIEELEIELPYREIYEQ